MRIWWYVPVVVCRFSLATSVGLCTLHIYSHGSNNRFHLQLSAAMVQRVRTVALQSALSSLLVLRARLEVSCNASDLCPAAKHNVLLTD